MSVTECLVRLKDHPLVDYVEPDGIGEGGVLPNDPDFPLQWHHRNTGSPPGSVRSDIHSPEAWAISRGSTNVTVAVLDTGLNMTLAEFTNRIVAGYDFANSDSDPSDDHGHGTAVAGTLCANANNTTLVAGVDWACRVMPVKVLNSSNWGLYSWWADGIDWAVSNGCKVINLSAGGSTGSATVSNAIMNAISRGVIFVTITHNDGNGNIRFPGRMQRCITVGATDSDDTRSSFSNYGSAIDLVAPGRDIHTVSSSGTLQARWGTSFSAPQVAGAAALLAALDPNISHEQARTLLCAGADDEVGDTQDAEGFDHYYGWGRLNVFNTLVLDQTELTMATGGDTNVLRWASPPNASNRLPFEVQSIGSLTGSWSTISQSSDFAYAPTQTTWRANGTVSSVECYRIHIRNQ